jgi:hypothetical protein
MSDPPTPSIADQLAQLRAEMEARLAASAPVSRPPPTAKPDSPEQIAARDAARRKLAEDAAKASPADVAQMVRDAAAQAPEPSKPIAEKLPFMARLARAAPGRMINLPINEGDLEAYQGRPFDKAAWLAAVDKALQDYDFGNVHHSTVILACRELADAAEGGRGMAQWTYDVWAGFTRCCRATIHKIIRALWDTELARIFNPMYWHGREQRHTANTYFPTIPPRYAEAVAETVVADETPAPAPTLAEPDSPEVPAAAPTGAVKAMARIAAARRELAAAFPGLHLGNPGLRTSALRAASIRKADREANRKGRPAPA